jgi:glutathione S-transferase
VTTLYFSPGSASFLVHWLLLELDIPHELRRVNLDAREHKSAAYLALNPAGVVPTLVLDGTPVTEAAAIALQLTDGTKLAPPLGPARAAYYQWMFLCANTLQPAFRAWFYPDEPAGADHADAAKAKARDKIEATFARFDAHLAANGPYLLGTSPTTVDFMLTMLMRWSRNMPKPAHTWPALGALAAAMKARPTFAELYKREGLTEWA